MKRMTKRKKKRIGKPRANFENNTETIIRLNGEILRILKLNGPMNANDIAMCLGKEKGKVETCLQTLERKKFLRGSEHEGRINYRLNLLGDIFLQNLEVLLKEKKGVSSGIGNEGLP